MRNLEKGLEPANVGLPSIHYTLFVMVMQFILALVAAGIWISVTVALLLNPRWPIAAAEGLLTLTLGYIYKYFFTLGKH